jgi:hypothetical protein
MDRMRVFVVVGCCTGWATPGLQRGDSSFFSTDPELGSTKGYNNLISVHLGAPTVDRMVD